MDKRIKITVLLIATLIIGMVIGFLISGRIVSNRIDNMRNNYSQTGFGREINRIIQPTEEQREKLQPVFHEFANKNRELMGTLDDERKKLFDELKDELKEILTADQIKRLEEHWQDKKRWYEEKKGRNQNGNRKNRPGSKRENRR